MEAASAHMLFVPQAHKDDVLGDRVARYLALELLENAVEGRLELPDTEQQRTLDAAVERIVRPTPETSLRHKRLEEQELSPVNASDVEQTERVRSERLDLIAVISGLRHDSEAELQFTPSLRVTVSTEDNGDGEAPEGAETIRRDRTFLRRLCCVSLVREHVPGSTAKFFLRRLRLLGPGEGAQISALPSSVVTGAFVVGLRIRVRLSNRSDRLTGGLGGINVDSTGALDTTRDFLESLARAAARYELEHAGPTSRWIGPPKSDEASPLARVVIVLQSQGGAANVSVIRTLVERRFGRAVRGNNTRREVLRHPDLLEFDADDSQLVRLTEHGARYFIAFSGAGGATQKLNPAKRR